MVTESFKTAPMEIEESRDEVVKHLMFHKSLIDEERSGERIDDYIDMVEGEDFFHISEDPFECAIATVFKLVIDEKMNPWNIDLLSFTEQFLEKADEKDKINFTVAGHLVKMAWSVLSMQCEEVLIDARDLEEGEEELEVDDTGAWEFFDWDFYEDERDVDYEEEVLDSNEVPLNKAVRRKEKKPVSLIQLVDAFEKARREAKYREKMERLRVERAEQMRDRRERRNEEYDSNAHQEDMKKDLSMVWNRICWYGQKVLEFDMIHDGRIRDYVTAFVSVLHLHKDKKIRVFQDELPTGQIMLKVLVPMDETEYTSSLIVGEEEIDEVPLENMMTL